MSNYLWNLSDRICLMYERCTNRVQCQAGLYRRTSKEVYQARSVVWWKEWILYPILLEENWLNEQNTMETSSVLFRLWHNLQSDFHLLQRSNYYFFRQWTMLVTARSFYKYCLHYLLPDMIILTAIARENSRGMTFQVPPEYQMVMDGPIPGVWRWQVKFKQTPSILASPGSIACLIFPSCPTVGSFI